MTNITNGTKCQSCTHNSVCAYTKEMTKFTKDVRKAHSFRGGMDSTFSVIRCVCCY